MITVICEFHDGMKECIRSSDGTCSKPFDVNQGLRPACVLSPLLFNVFIAAVLIVVLQKFNEDVDVLAELTHPQEQPRETRPESPTDCVRRDVWGMLYADLDHTSRTLQEITYCPHRAPLGIIGAR